MGGKRGIRKVGWFLPALLVMALARLWMLHGLPINPLVGAACDDALLVKWALHLFEGTWTGPFSCYTFMKEIGFSAYLAALCRLKLPYIMATNLLYIGGCLVLLYAISHIVKQKWALYAIYAVLLFHPVMAAVQTGQRVYRNSFAVALAVWVVGCVLNLYFDIGKKPFYRSFIWAALAAGSLGVLWETKSDTIWLLPFTVAVLLATAFLVLKNRKVLAPLPRLALVTFPILGIILTSHFVDIVNTKVYGAAGVAYYGPTMSILTNLDEEGAEKNISLPRKTFQKLCSISPTLALVQAEIEAEMDAYDAYDTKPGDGNVEDGWLGWALIGGIDKAGYYKDCQTANEFYKNVHQELSAGIEEGVIKVKQHSMLDSYHFSTGKDRKELLAAIGEIWRYVASHAKMQSDVCPVDLEGSKGFEALTNEKSYHGFMDTDYYCTGWVTFPQYDLKDLKAYVEDSAGNQYGELEFLESKDVEGQHSGIKGAGNCRFELGWDYGGAEEESPQFFIAAYQEGKQVAKSGFTKEGFLEEDETAVLGSIDSFADNGQIQQYHVTAERAVNRCNAVYQMYHAVGSALSWAGLAAYAGFTLLALWGWLEKRRAAGKANMQGQESCAGTGIQQEAGTGGIADMAEKTEGREILLQVHGKEGRNAGTYSGDTCITLNSWLVVTGIYLSLLVLFAGVAVTHLQDCPAINYMYLSSAYPFFNLAAMLSILKCGELVFQQIKQKKPIRG